MTTDTNPLLADLELPPFSAVRPEHVLPAIEAVIVDYRAAVDALAADASPALDRARQALVDDSLRGFRLSGVALPEAERERFKAIQTELSRVETGFEEAVLDATDAWTRPVSAAELAGLPDSGRALLAQAAKDQGVEGHLATLKGPVVQAILGFADSRDLRA